jgi:hypothetical protein
VKQSPIELKKIASRLSRPFVIFVVQTPTTQHGRQKRFLSADGRRALSLQAVKVRSQLRRGTAKVICSPCLCSAQVRDLRFHEPVNEPPGRGPDLSEGQTPDLDKALAIWDSREMTCPAGHHEG